MTWWIIGTDHLGVPTFVPWDRGDDHPAFEYFGVVEIL
jgi:hypothetical protein